MYKRKTIDEYDIEGYYINCWEVVTTEINRKDALVNLKLYIEAEPKTTFRIKKHRVKI